jgi:uncharacterized membrane protein YhaH (DUF805 family)
VKWYLHCWRHYADADGRAGRPEFWYFTLFHLLVCVGLAITDILSGLFSPTVGIGLLSGIYLVASAIPALFVGIRRLHDTNRSGWWVLIGAVPYIGAVILYVLLALRSTDGKNDYGGEPNALAA